MAHGRRAAEPTVAVLKDTVGNERARRLAEQALRAILLGWRTEVPENG
ncbi:hypothetical protein [Amycolatopsis tolypomycina]